VFACVSKTETSISQKEMSEKIKRKNINNKQDNQEKFVNKDG
jgi:hypothetical protein